MEEQATVRVRKKLKDENVKLWLPPYTVDEAEGTFPSDFVQRYATDLQLEPAVVLDTLKYLRNHAVAKLAANKKYSATGVATLRVKVLDPRQQSPRALELFEIKLQESGQKLREMVAATCSSEPGKVKLISGGRVIQDNSPLLEQGVGHNGQLMALVLVETAAESHDREKQEVELCKIREDADLLSSVDTDDPRGYYMQIADQTGKPIPLPKEERKALSVAMVLHEKGRTALKHKKYSEALLLLLEADKEFRLAERISRHVGTVRECLTP